MARQWYPAPSGSHAIDEAFRQAFDGIYGLQQAIQAPQGNSQGLQVSAGLLLTPTSNGNQIISQAPSGVTAGTYVLAKVTGGGANGSITIDQFGRITAFTAGT